MYDITKKILWGKYQDKLKLAHDLTILWENVSRSENLLGLYN